MKSLTTVLTAALVASCGSAQAPTTSEKTLIGGTPVPPGERPEIVLIRFAPYSCTATVVGTRTVVSAAHCMNDGGTITFQAGSQSYSAVCRHSPQYSQAAFEKLTALMKAQGDDRATLIGGMSDQELANATADFAVCLTNKEVTGFKYAHVNTDKGILKVGDRMQHWGYGCTSWNGPGFGTLRTGFARVVGLPSGSNYDITTQKSGSDGAVLCSGDSGGPSGVIQGGVVKVVSTNSRSNTTSASYVPAWYTSVGMSLLTSWASGNGQRICGVHSDAQGCQGVEPGPTPGPTVTPTVTPTPPTPGPTPVPPLPSVDSCKGALKALDAKLFHKPYGDVTAEMALLVKCAASTKPLPETAHAAP